MPIAGHLDEKHRAMEQAEPSKLVTGIATARRPRTFPITVSVFTSDGCVFCKEALAMIHEAAKNLSYDQLAVKIVELPLDERPDLARSLEIVAVPTIQIGRSRVVGLPLVEEIESLMHEAVLTPDDV